MTHSFAVVQSDRAHAHSRADEFSSSQLSEAYGTIFALKLKLELGARELSRLCEARESPAFVPVKSTIETLVDIAIADRVRRGTILPAALFADPAWDMLLELYRAELRQRRVTVSNLCTASQGPAMTALRWIGNLTSEGLVTRSQDPLDGRRYYIRLTEKGSKAMTAYFSSNPPAEVARQCA